MSTPETQDSAPATEATAPSVVPPAYEAAPIPPAYDGVAAGVPTGPEAAAPPTGPRVRWAGVVWGLALAAIAGLAVWVLTDPGRQAAVVEWMLALTPASTAAYVVLVVGGFALVAGVVGLARRAQRALERRGTPQTPVVE